MGELIKSLNFRFMAAAFKVRDFFKPPESKLEQAGIRPGHYVLDFGCGPGAYSIAAAELVGNQGKVYALDILPLAIEYVKQAASKKGLENMEFICSGLETGLDSESIDLILLYDIYHGLDAPKGILKELHRVLKLEGLLSFSDHHMKEDAILESLNGSGLFSFLSKGEGTYSFSRRPLCI